MEEELKEVWTTQIRPVTKFSNNDYYRRKDKGQIEAFDNLSEYKPTYLPTGVMGYDGSNKTYRQLKTIKVRNSDGSFDYYMVPEFAVEGVYVDQPKSVVEPIPDLATQSNQAVVEPQRQPVQQQPTQKPATPKSTPVVKQQVPQNLLPYIANVSSDGVAFFNVPEGYTNDQFEEAVKAVYRQNNGLTQKPMVYYEQPKQQIQQQKQQQQAAQQHQKQYQTQRQQTAQKQGIKYTTNGQTKTVEVPVKKTNKYDLVTEAFAYPSRTVNVYNIHPEAYQKVLEYLNNNFNKTKTNNKPEKYVLSFSRLEKVPIGGEVNDTTFHYIDKNGKDLIASRTRFDNANIINENESIFDRGIYGDVVTDNGKLKLYLNSDNNEIYYKDINGFYVGDTLKLYTMSKVGESPLGKSTVEIPELREMNLTKQQIADYINKHKNTLLEQEEHDIDRSIFRPVEKEQTTQNNSEQQVKSVNNSGQQTKNTNNLVQKAKQAGKKVLSFLGFQNGGQLKYYKNGK